MLQPRVSVPIFMVVVVPLTAIAPPAVGTIHDHDIDIDGSIGTVDKTVLTLQGESTVTQVGSANAGDTVSISVDAPSGSSYTITILDSEQRLRRAADATGDANREFGADGLKPGTYVIVAGNQSTEEVYTGEPLVAHAYAVSVQVAEGVELSDDLNVTVEFNEVESSESIEAVEVVLMGDSGNLRVDVSTVSDMHCSASISTNDMDAGDYSLYAVVRGDDQALDEDELIGASGASTVEVVEQSDTPTPDKGFDGTGGGGGGGGGAADDATETTTTESDDMSTSTIDTVATTDDDEPSITESTETAGATELTATTTADNAVMPNEPTTTAQATTLSRAPNMALHVLFGALVVFTVGHRLVG